MDYRHFNSSTGSIIDYVIILRYIWHVVALCACEYIFVLSVNEHVFVLCVIEHFVILIVNERIVAVT